MSVYLDKGQMGSKHKKRHLQTLQNKKRNFIKKKFSLLQPFASVFIIQNINTLKSYIKVKYQVILAASG